MKCATCGRPLTSGALFCTNCGAAVLNQPKDNQASSLSAQFGEHHSPQRPHGIDRSRLRRAPQPRERAVTAPLLANTHQDEKLLPAHASPSTDYDPAPHLRPHPLSKTIRTAAPAKPVVAPATPFGNDFPIIPPAPTRPAAPAPVEHTLAHGKPQHHPDVPGPRYPFGDQMSDKNYFTAFLWAFFAGTFGADRFYTGQYMVGLLKLATLGGYGIWSFLDIILLLADARRDRWGRPLWGRNKTFRTSLWLFLGLCFLVALGLLALALFFPWDRLLSGNLTPSGSPSYF